MLKELDVAFNVRLAAALLCKFCKVLPSKVKFDSPINAFAPVAVITLLSAPLVIGKPPTKLVAVTTPAVPN